MQKSDEPPECNFPTYNTNVRYLCAESVLVMNFPATAVNRTRAFHSRLRLLYWERWRDHRKDVNLLWTLLWLLQFLDKRKLSPGKGCPSLCRGAVENSAWQVGGVSVQPASMANRSVESPSQSKAHAHCCWSEDGLFIRDTRCKKEYLSFSQIYNN